MKTYYIKPEDCEDIGWAYKVDGAEYDGNLIIDVGKTIVIEGNQTVEGYQIVKGDQRVKGDQTVKGDQRVKGYQRVKGKEIIGHCKWGVVYYKENIKIGCKTKTTSEWHNWFNSDQVYETERDSLAFSQIYKTFLMAEIAQKNDKGLA